jgi:hypothetical protein
LLPLSPPPLTPRTRPCRQRSVAQPTSIASAIKPIADPNPTATPASYVQGAGGGGNGGGEGGGVGVGEGGGGEAARATLETVKAVPHDGGSSASLEHSHAHLPRHTVMAERMASTHVA